MSDTSSDADDEVLEDARAKFKRCQDWESEARIRMADDLKFAEGDSINGYQWESELAADRQLQRKPCLTINMVREKNLQIINDARQNKPGIEIRAIGDGATYEAAKVFEGIVRHIEYISNAQAAYDTATDAQVKAGKGAWRVLTRYATDEPSPDAFNQEIIIQRIGDANSVYQDPDIQQNDGSDATFGFIFRDWNRKDFEKKHPDLKDDMTSSTLDASHDWVGDHHVREAEFFRRVDKTAWLIERTDGSVAWEKDLDDAEIAMLKAMKTQRRKVTKPQIEVFKIIGNKVIERKEWLGAYVPIVVLVGERTVIDGRLDIKGHTRAQRDAQQYYNFTASASAEYLAGQTKTPWLAAAEAVEGYEEYYNNANVQTTPWLPWKQWNDDGTRENDRPQRIEPPASATAYNQAMQIAEQQMMKVTGQYEANLGAPSNETSGIAIQQRQRKGDNATYHYIDRLGQAIRFTGRILVDLIPKVYDTPRVLQILGEDGSQKAVQLDPSAPAAHTQRQDEEAEDYDPAQVAAIFNPNVGRYEVEADIGPSYATKRQDEFNALSQIMAQNQEAMKIAGDLLFGAADFPGADVLAERWRRSIDPHLLGADGPPPAVVQMQQHFGQQAQEMQAEIVRLQGELADRERKLKDRQQDLVTNDYRAETDRLKAMGAVDPQLLQLIARQLYEQMTDTSIVPLLAHHEQVKQVTQPPPDPALPQPPPAAPGATTGPGP